MKNEGMKAVLKTIVEEFGRDIQFRVRLNDGRVFKTKDWDKLNRVYTYRRKK